MSHGSSKCARDEKVRDSVQGGEDPSDAFSCRLFFAKEPLIIGLFCGRFPFKDEASYGIMHVMPALYPCMHTVISLSSLKGNFPQKSHIISGSFANL